MKNRIKTFKKWLTNKKRWIPLILGTILIVFAFIFYSFQFGFSLSKDQTVWGEFGDYMNVFVAIANLFVIGYLTIFFAEMEEQRDKENRTLEEFKIRPNLIFKDIGAKWACRNIGEGAAMNIMIAYKTSNVGQWENPIKIYSLVPKEEFVIEWRKSLIYKWAAVYYDIRGNVITSTCENDDTNVYIGKNELIAFKNNYKRLEDVKNVSFD
jgi:hypothetical protein